MFKYRERIFDGPEGLLSKRQQAQQQRMEEANDIAAPILIGSKVPLTLVTEAITSNPEGQIPELDRIYGYDFGHESGKEGKTGYMTR
jgi:hypothetical protein